MEVSKRILIEARTNKDEYSAGETIQVSITIINKSSAPFKLFFTSAQRYDFIILKEDQEIWRWSKDKQFAMVLGFMNLEPGDQRTYAEEWKPINEPPGEYKLVGVLTSRPPLNATCTFRIVERI